MLLNTDSFADPRLLALNTREKWLFIQAFCYSSRWNLPRLERVLQRGVGVTPRVARSFAEAGLARLESDGALVWDCYDLARFTPRSDRVERAERGGGFTYLIQSGEDGPVKIGSTHKDPEERLRALQTGSSEQLRLLKVLDGAHLERELHAEYESFRVRGEWFDPQILDVIE